MNRKCLLLIPLFFSSIIITACDNKPAVKTAMEPEVGVVTLAPSSVNIKSELPGRALAFEIAEIRPQVGGIIIKRNFVEGDKVSKGESLYQIDPARCRHDWTQPKARWQRHRLPPIMFV